MRRPTGSPHRMRASWRPNCRPRANCGRSLASPCGRRRCTTASHGGSRSRRAASRCSLTRQDAADRRPGRLGGPPRLRCRRLQRPPGLLPAWVGVGRVPAARSGRSGSACADNATSAPAAGPRRAGPGRRGAATPLQPAALHRRRPPGPVPGYAATGRAAEGAWFCVLDDPARVSAVAALVRRSERDLA